MDFSEMTLSQLKPKVKALAEDGHPKTEKDLKLAEREHKVAAQPNRRSDSGKRSR